MNHTGLVNIVRRKREHTAQTVKTKDKLLTENTPSNFVDSPSANKTNYIYGNCSDRLRASPPFLYILSLTDISCPASLSPLCQGHKQMLQHWVLENKITSTGI